jgi:hypothetical protein
VVGYYEWKRQQRRNRITGMIIGVSALTIFAALAKVTVCVFETFGFGL